MESVPVIGKLVIWNVKNNHGTNQRAQIYISAEAPLKSYDFQELTNYIKWALKWEVEVIDT